MVHLLSRGDVADLLGVSMRTVDRLRAEGELRSVLVRGCVRFTAADVQAYIDAQRKGDRP